MRNLYFNVKMLRQRGLIIFLIKQIPLKHMRNLCFNVKMVGQRRLIILKLNKFR